ncbi:MAG: Na+/H+ antiporter NhaA [Bdellovibrionaceae bacterium]|nr:Na+/H+ antiporter NhaA [Pseudobdellovibrionaceae bacterium]
MVTSPLQSFLRLEASGGIVLFISAALAMVFANYSPLISVYEQLINTPIAINFGDFILSKSLLLLVNDGLMAIFFYLVGLEIKRELLDGDLSSPKKASFSILAALGGMALPALLFISLNLGSPSIKGWGIPMATDIAFALGALALLGSRVPTALKIFLLALAIVDDLGAISVIALFYTNEIAASYLGFAGISLLTLTMLNYAGFRNMGIGIILGVITWFFFLKSGIHATLAGVFLAFLTPASSIPGEGEPKPAKTELLDRYIHALHPWVAFGIMPVFAFFNAGVTLVGVDFAEVLQGSVAIGVILGLVLGKPLGIFLFTYIPAKLKWVELPDGITWSQVTAVGFLAGIGFTMSLFIGSLAYTETLSITESKLGIMVGSLIAAGLGLTSLWLTVPNKA